MNGNRYYLISFLFLYIIIIGIQNLVLVDFFDFSAALSIETCNNGEVVSQVSWETDFEHFILRLLAD